MDNSSDLLDKGASLSCWVVTEGMVGTENQCLGVAEALGLEPTIIKIGLKQPWKALSPWLGFEVNRAFTSPLLPPYPDIVIASGRKSIAASRYIKKKSNGKCFTVQIQDPKVSSKCFDLVAAPHHDELRGDNVIVTHGAPNKLTPNKLAEAKKEFAPVFEKLKSPRVAVLIGGNSKTHKMTPDVTTKMVVQLKQLDASLMITASRRTGEENMKVIKDELNAPQNYIWDGQGENPYLGMLAWADYIIVTEDSVSMMSDAATTGKPVYVIEMEGSSPRFDKFHSHYQGIGVSRPFDGNLQQWEYEPIFDAQQIAQRIIEKLG